ncbi:MAG TPA: NPCBM/NEW2 domain-containing protein, partial [Tepidisphaeraceae bacterium]|nr:NPCBM/NEW2 domain-containing protein [Tepidisphaeraceae bacterium]
MLSRRQMLQTGATLAMAPQGWAAKAPGQIELNLQTRNRDGDVRTSKESVDPKKVAVFAIDVWHYHWCRTWRNRTGSLIPRFNHSFDAGHEIGMIFVFSPTNAMRDLNDCPQRKNTLALPAYALPPISKLEDRYSTELRFGMCECGLGDDCHYTNNVNNQHPDLKMAVEDYIALTQQEAYNVLCHRGITHIIYTGFATNMCMWAKPTGMKYMRQFGFRCMVARDLTEAITRYAEESFNPTQGTLEVIELIERELAPTISMENTLRQAGTWKEGEVLDFVHIAPWDRFFGGPVYEIPLQAELTCRHVPGAELRYTLDHSDPISTSRLYSKPIKIEDNAVLKAAGFKGAERVTRISIAHYWKMPEVPPPPDIYISDLTPVTSWTGEPRPESYAVRKEPRFNRSVDGNILSNRSRKFAKGIGIQAPARLAFSLKPQYRRFVALACVDDECIHWDHPDGLSQWPQWSRPIHGPTSYRISQIIFKVLADGKQVAQTPALFNGNTAWGIDVRLPDDA